LGYVPAPLSLFEGIQKVLPGHFLVFEKGDIRDYEYWDIGFDVVGEKSESEWIEIVREKLWEAIRIRLVSDVPLGAFLSGGIDSSAIVAVMAQLSSQPVKTYSIGFEGEDSFYNELPYASMVAKQFNTDHHEIIVRPDVSELLPQLLWHLDEPIADSAFITTYLIARSAQKEVKVVLSGVGGDELFGGYRRYLGESLQRYYQWLPYQFRTNWIPNALGRLSQDRHSSFANMVRYGNAFFQSAEWSPEDRYLSYIQVFSKEVRSQIFQTRPSESLVSPETSPLLIREYFKKYSFPDSLSQALYVDMKTSLVDDLLMLTDKATMAASIECRAPFMDHELVELVGRMPSSLKVRGFTLKYLLKKVLEPLLPKEILYRSKRGFGAPMGAWLRKDLESLIHDTLSEKAVKKRGLLDWGTVRNTIQAHNDLKKDHTDHLLALVNLELWSRNFLDGTDWNCA
jgi:asparagine synthase (glutamine-hydrolysing)